MPAKGRRPHWGKHPPCGSLQQCRAGLTPQGALSKATDILAMQDRASSLVFRQLEGPLTYLPPANPCFPLWNTGSKGGCTSTPPCMWRSSQPLHTAGSARPGELGPPFWPVSEPSLGTIPVLSAGQWTALSRTTRPGRPSLAI